MTREFLPAAILGLALLASAARAGCVQECSTQCSMYVEGECTEHTQTCTCTPTAPPAPYGAIAYGSRSGAFGFSYNQNSVSRAGQVAMTNCAKHGRDCGIVLNMTHSCGALAAADNGSFETGSGSARGIAQNAALSACRMHAGKSCAIQVWTCSP